MGVYGAVGARVGEVTIRRAHHDKIASPRLGVGLGFGDGDAFCGRHEARQHLGVEPRIEQTFFRGVDYAADF